MARCMAHLQVLEPCTQNNMTAITQSKQLRNTVYLMCWDTAGHCNNLTTPGDTGKHHSKGHTSWILHDVIIRSAGPHTCCRVAVKAPAASEHNRPRAGSQLAAATTVGMSSPGRDTLLVPADSGSRVWCECATRRPACCLLHPRGQLLPSGICDILHCNSTIRTHEHQILK